MGQFDLTLGTIVVGIFVNTYLYGLVTYQFAAYYRTKFNDPSTVRYMVFFMFALDTFHSIAAAYMAYDYTVTHYGDPDVFGLSAWPYQFTPIGTSLAAFATQLYLGFRIWRLTGSKILYGAVIMLAIPSLALGMGCGVMSWSIQTRAAVPRIRALAIAWLSMQGIVDTFITVTLIIVFSRSRTGFPKTDTILNYLARGAIQSGLFIGTFSLGNLITFITLPNTNLYGMFAIPIGRIYTNTLLSTLLARQALRNEISTSYDARMTGPRSVNPTDSVQANPKLYPTNIELEVRHSDLERCGHSSSEDVERKGVIVQ